MTKLYDRTGELRELRPLLERPGPTVAMLYGRRRVGKTFLLNRVWPREATFYFVAAETTPEINRREILDEVARQTGRVVEAEDYPTWRTVFRLLFELNAPDPAVVILDEYQYLRGGDDDVDSQLLAALELYRNAGSDRPLVLVLCGSLVRAMEQLDSVGAPLHGRFQWTGQLHPFDYYDAGAMAGFDGLRDRAYAYGIFGGTPSYLAGIDQGASLSENVCRSVLAPRGEVRRQVETSIEQEQGLRKVSDYRAVMTAIGQGRTTRNEIAQGAGLEKNYGLVTMLETLERLGYVRSTRNFDAASNEPYRYRLADPAVRFHYQLVNRFRTELEVNPPTEVWRAHLADRLDAYMGRVFEEMAEQAYHRRRRSDGLPMVADWGRWEGRDRARESLEMDIVARLTGGGMLTGAVKWNRHPVTIRLHHDHLRDLDRLKTAGRGWAHEATENRSRLLYVAAGGFEAGFRDQAEEDGLPVTAWSLADLYEPRRPGA